MFFLQHLNPLLVNKGTHLPQRYTVTFFESRDVIGHVIILLAIIIWFPIGGPL